jgi:ankyrin repeat protein
MGSLRSLRRNHVEPVIIPKPTDEELMKAILFGTVKQVKALLERGANANAGDKEWGAALDYAARNGKLRLTQVLVKYGADVNRKNSLQKTPLHGALSCWWRETAQKVSLFLLNHGADVNAVDTNGRTTLMYAVIYKRFDLAKLLVERGVDSKRRNRDWKRAVDLIGHGKGSKALRKMLKKIP